LTIWIYVKEPVKLEVDSSSLVVPAIMISGGYGLAVAPCFVCNIRIPNKLAWKKQF